MCFLVFGDLCKVFFERASGCGKSYDQIDSPFWCRFSGENIIDSGHFFPNGPAGEKDGMSSEDIQILPQ